MNIFNTETQQVITLPALIVNEINCSNDIYGNMDISSKFDDAPEGVDAEISGKTDDIEWWVNYGKSYNEVTSTIDVICDEFSQECGDTVSAINSIIQDQTISEYVWDTNADYTDECCFALERASEILQAINA